MSIGHVNPDLAAKLPLERIAEICQKHGVSELSVYRLIAEEGAEPDEGPLFLATFHNDDAGPWGSKLDDLENDLAGVMHRAVHVASRRGIEQSSLPSRRELILGSAQRIYEA